MSFSCQVVASSGVLLPPVDKRSSEWFIPVVELLGADLAGGQVPCIGLRAIGQEQLQFHGTLRVRHVTRTMTQDSCTAFRRRVIN